MVEGISPSYESENMALVTLLPLIQGPLDGMFAEPEEVVDGRLALTVRPLPSAKPDWYAQELRWAPGTPEDPGLFKVTYRLSEDGTRLEHVPEEREELR